MKPQPLTWVEISTSSIVHNICTLRRTLGSHVAFMPVIKSNAYGHDMLGIAKLCDARPEVDMLCTVSLDEALALKRAGIRKPVLVLAIVNLHDLQSIAEGIKKGIRFPLYSEELAKVLSKLSKRLKKRAVVHFKVDVGTSRIGILAKEGALFGQKMCSNYNNLVYEGIYSHFASSESDSALTHKQLTLFKTVLSEYAERGVVVPPLQHIACSSASFKSPKAQLTGARIGINLYGLQSLAKGDKLPSIKPALSWYTSIIQIKTVPSNTGISYGHTFVTQRATKVAILPVGYYDGFDRKLSNTGSVLVRGVRCPVIGRVCMNLTMVDISKVSNAKLGDRVVLIGKINNVEISADDLAKHIGTINYEVVTRINPNIPRIFV